MKLRIVQVGLGGWGQDWAANVVSRNTDVETVAWVEIVEEALDKAQKRLKLPKERCFRTLEEALAAYETDAVLITASLPGHVPSALTALQADKHVLLEKPFAPTIAEALQVVEMAEQRKRILMISQNYRYTAGVQAAIELVRKQVLGRVGMVNIDFRRYANGGPVEGNRHYTLWQPLLVDMAIHHFDLMRAVLGQEPTKVSCQLWNPPWSHFVEPPAGGATITFDGGAVVNYRGSWISTGPQTNWSGDWRMECELGEIAWTSRGELPEHVLLRPLGKPEQPVPLSKMALEDRNGSLNAFVQSVRAGEQPITSGRNNLKTLALMYGAVESATTGLSVTIPQL